MTEHVVIKKLELETASGKRIDLTVEEAREVHSALDNFFGYPIPGVWTPRDGVPYSVGNGVTITCKGA